jgi:hypothetical protein
MAWIVGSNPRKGLDPSQSLTRVERGLGQIAGHRRVDRDDIAVLESCIFVRQASYDFLATQVAQSLGAWW